MYVTSSGPVIKTKWVLKISRVSESPSFKGSLNLRQAERFTCPCYYGELVRTSVSTIYRINDNIEAVEYSAWCSAHDEGSYNLKGVC